MPVRVTTAPAAEPISTADAKLHLRVDASDDDALIDDLIKTARRHVEQRIWRSLIDTTLELTLECLPGGAGEIYLPFGPVDSIATFAYVATDGSGQTLNVTTQIQKSLYTDPPFLVPAYNTNWPSTRNQVAAATITYVAGYGTAGTDVPQDILAALYLLIGNLYENRENHPLVPVGSVTESTAIDALLGPYAHHDPLLMTSV